MRIGVITTSYPRGSNDFAGRFVKQHVDLLQTRAQVQVIAAGNGQGTANIIRVAHHPKLFYAGGAPDALEDRPSLLWHGALFTTKQQLAIRRLSRHWQGAFLHWTVPNELTIACPTLPRVLIGHSGDIHLLSRHPVLAALWLRRLLRQPVYFALVSRPLRNRLLSLAFSRDRQALAKRCSVCPMGVPSPKPSEHRAKHILYMGRMTKQKGVDLLIEAAALARISTKLVLAGDGPERRNLERRAAELGIDHEFVGIATGNFKDKLLSEAAAVILPSRFGRQGRTEGTPTIIGEALAKGVPVLASALGGCVDLPVTLVPPNDSASLANFLAKLAHTRALKRQDASKWLKDHSWDRTEGLLWRLLEKAQAL